MQNKRKTLYLKALSPKVTDRPAASLAAMTAQKSVETTLELLGGLCQANVKLNSN